AAAGRGGSERAHSRGEGRNLRHPAGTASARAGAVEIPRRLPATRRHRRATGWGKDGDLVSNRVRDPQADAQADVFDVAARSGYPEDHPPRVGFFTDTSVCIGCKACEVACKEWNLVPEDGLDLLGTSYDNTGDLGASTWRHVAFIEQTAPRREPVDLGMPSLPASGPSGGQETAEPDRELQWLMMSDVCKHCTHAACLDVCPTGSLFRTEFGTVVVQEDICNGCGYCVPACPYGVID